MIDRCFSLEGILFINMVNIGSFWILSVALLLLASPLLQVARCQTDSDEVVQTTEDARDDIRIVVQDFGTFTTSAPGIDDTITVFPNNNSAKLVTTVGQQTELLVGVKNNGESNLNVVAIKASLHQIVENLTAQVFNKGTPVPASAQATFPYIFEVGNFLEPGNFGLVGTIVYEIDGQSYQSTFYYGTIEVVISKYFRSKVSIVLVTVGLNLAAAYAGWICSQLLHPSKKTKRAPKLEVGTRCRCFNQLMV